MLDAHYTFAPDPDGGFNDVRYVSGRSAPTTLPSLQVDATTHAGKVRYAVPEDTDRLVASVLKIESATAAHPVEIEYRLILEEDPHFANPLFWPRISLDLDGHLLVTARSKPEIEMVIALAGAFARNPKAFLRGEPTVWEVAGGVEHPVGIVPRPNDELRVISKIALGVAACLLGPEVVGGPSFETIRSFVREGSESLPGRRILPGKVLEGWPDHHLVIIVRLSGRLHGIVCLSGLCFEVELARTDPSDKDAVLGGAVSRRDGSETYFVSVDEAKKIFNTIRGVLESAEGINEVGGEG